MSRTLSLYGNGWLYTPAVGVPYGDIMGYIWNSHGRDIFDALWMIDDMGRNGCTHTHTRAENIYRRQKRRKKKKQEKAKEEKNPEERAPRRKKGKRIRNNREKI